MLLNSNKRAHRYPDRDSKSSIQPDMWRFFEFVQAKAEETFPLEMRMRHYPDGKWTDTEVPWAAIVVGSLITHQVVHWFLEHGLSSLLFGSTYRALSIKHKLDWNSRVVSTLHALACILFGFSALAEVGYEIPEDFTWTITPLLHQWMAVSLGYFVYDTLLGIKDWHWGNFSVSMAIHHVVAVLAYTYPVIFQNGAYWGAIWLFTEASTPFVHARVFLLRAGYRKSLIYVLNGIAMCLGFVALRMPIQVFTFWTILREQENLAQLPDVFRVCLYLGWTATTVLNSFWSVKITKGLFKALAHTDVQKQPAPEKKVK